MKRVIVFAGAALALYLLVSVFASISQLAEFADRFSPVTGQIVFWLLTAAVAALVISPLVLYYRLPAALIPPDETEGPKHDAYIEALRERLASNPNLRGQPLGTDAEVAAALAILSAQAERITRETASAVFVATAVMQNGRVDGLVVLATQTRMVWQIARLYHQRPSGRQMVYLYSNVAVTALVAANLENIDFSELVAPLAVAVVPSLKGAVPGLQGVSSLLVNSLAHGAANAFLTLRVGAVARQYCAALSTPSRQIVRRNATAAALVHVGQIAKENGAAIIKSVMNTAMTMPSEWVGSAVQTAKNFSNSVTGRFRRRSADEP